MRKNFNLLLTLSMIGFFLVSCEKNDTELDENLKKEGRISFSLTSLESELKSSSIDDFSKLSNAVISIANHNSDSTLIDLQELKLFRIGEALYTEEISLPEGDYELTQFFLQDSANNTLYACPHEGSEQAQNVQNPLPVEFSVAAKETTPVAVEVLSTKDHSPGDFGFSYFEIGFVDTFPLLVNIIDAETQELLSGELEISADSSYSFVKAIDAVMFNRVSVKDGIQSYTISVDKEGYEVYTERFLLDSLKAYDQTPLTISLSKESSSLSESLILNYELNSNAFDFGIYGYNLDVSNAELCQDRFNRDSMAYSFDGQSKLTLYDVPIINQSEAQSLTVWFKTTESHSSREYGGVLITILGSENGYDGSRFSLNIKNGYLRGNYGDGWLDTDQEWNDRLTSETRYDDGEWHFATFVSTGDDGLISLYADGVLVGQQVPLRSNHDQLEGLDIKIGGENYRSFFNGCIDNVKLYDKALSQEEINYLYNQQ